MLHNIEPIQNGWALRKGDMKLVYAETGYTKRNPLWYGPHGPVGPDDTHFQTNHKLIPEHLQQTKLDKILQSINRVPVTPRPFTVNCGEKPENASTNCNVSVAPCLFNVTADPCEYYNLAFDLPEVVEELLQRLQEYNATAVAVRSKGTDPESFPRNHKGFWVPWVELDEKKSVGTT